MMIVGHNLYFDMTGALNKFFEENGIIPESIFRLTSCFRKSFIKFFFRSDHPHTPAAAA